MPTETLNLDAVQQLIIHAEEVGFIDNAEARRLTADIVHSSGEGETAQAAQSRLSDFWTRLAESTYAATDTEIARILAKDAAARRGDATALQRTSKRIGGGGSATPRRGPATRTPAPPPPDQVFTYPTEVMEEPNAEAQAVFRQWKQEGWVNESGRLDPEKFEQWENITSALRSARSAGWTGEWPSLFQMIALEGKSWGRETCQNATILIRTLHAAGRMPPEQATEVVYRDFIKHSVGNLSSYGSNSDPWKNPSTIATLIHNAFRTVSVLMELLQGLPRGVLDSLQTEIFRGESSAKFIGQVLASWQQRFGMEHRPIAEMLVLSTAEIQTHLENPVGGEGGGRGGEGEPVQARPVASVGEAYGRAEELQTTRTAASEPVFVRMPPAPDSACVFPEFTNLGGGNFILEIEEPDPPQTERPTAPARSAISGKIPADTIGSGVPSLRAALGLGATSVALGTPRFTAAYGITRAITGEWQSFRAVPLTNTLAFFGVMSLFCEVTRFAVRGWFPNVLRRSFIGIFLLHALPLSVGMVSANYVATGSPGFLNIPVTIPSLMGASFLVNKAFDLRKAIDWTNQQTSFLTKGIRPQTSAFGRRIQIRTGIGLAVYGATTLVRDVAIFSLVHLFHKGAERGLRAALPAARQEVWDFENAATFAMGEEMARKNLGVEYQNCAENNYRCWKTLDRFSGESPRFRISSKTDLDEWRTRREKGIENFYEVRWKSTFERLSPDF